MEHTEDGLRRMLSRVLGQWWHLQRHEDKLSTGIADVSYAGEGMDGWMELKVCKSGPWLKGLKAHQKAWLTKRGKAGSGRVFVVVWVKNTKENTLAMYRWDRLKEKWAKSAPIQIDLRGEADEVRRKVVQVLS